MSDQDWEGCDKPTAVPQVKRTNALNGLWILSNLIRVASAVGVAEAWAYHVRFRMIRGQCISTRIICMSILPFMKSFPLSIFPVKACVLPISKFGSPCDGQYRGLPSVEVPASTWRGCCASVYPGCTVEWCLLVLLPCDSRHSIRPRKSISGVEG